MWTGNTKRRKGTAFYTFSACAAAKSYLHYFSISADFSEIAKLVLHLRADGLHYIMNSFLVGERAISVPAQLRLGLASKVQHQLSIQSSAEVIIAYLQQRRIFANIFVKV
jgi:hypothetical protein